MARLSRYVAFGDQAVSSISNFVAVAITANVATPGQFGQFSLGYAGLLLFLGAQRALIGETMLVKYSAAGSLKAPVRRGVLGASVLVAAATVPLLLAGAVVAAQSARLIWFVIAASLPFDAVWAVLSITSMVAVAATTGAVWAVVLCWGGGAAAALVLGLLLGRVLPSLRDGRRWLGVNRNPGLRYLGEFSALNASNFVVLYLLALPLGAAGVGALRAAQLLFSPLNTAFSAIKMAVIPELVRSKGTAVFRMRLIETAVVVAAMAGLWGAAVIADSGVFSTALSETIDPRFVGTALTAQTAAGFLLTVLTIQAVPVIADLFGWRYAFLILAPGPLLGAAAMSAFTARQHHQHQEEIDHDHIYPRGADRGTDGSALTHRS